MPRGKLLGPPAHMHRAWGFCSGSWVCTLKLTSRSYADAVCLAVYLLPCKHGEVFGKEGQSLCATSMKRVGCVLTTVVQGESECCCVGCEIGSGFGSHSVQVRVKTAALSVTVADISNRPLVTPGIPHTPASMTEVPMGKGQRCL